MLKSNSKGYEEAKELNASIGSLITALRNTKSDSERLVAEQALRQCVASGIYEHFKSDENDQKLYAVFGVVPDVNNIMPPMVNYAALYAPHAGEMVGRLLLHSEDGFWGPIDRPAYKGPRFKLLHALKRGELELLLGKIELRGAFPGSRDRTLQIIETAFGLKRAS